MEEDQETGHKRCQLRAEMDKLDQALDSINQLEDNYAKPIALTDAYQRPFATSEVDLQSQVDDEDV